MPIASPPTTRTSPTTPITPHTPLRALQLLTFPSKPPRASLYGTLCHWAIFIPEIGRPRQGKVIHVLGTPDRGYELEFTRRVDLNHARRKWQKTTIGYVAGKYVGATGFEPPTSTNPNPNPHHRRRPSSTTTTASAYKETTPKDTLELQASLVRAPESKSGPLPPPTVTCVDPSEVVGFFTLVKGKTCRDWCFDYVRRLIATRILAPDALAVLHEVRAVEESGGGIGGVRGSFECRAQAVGGGGGGGGSGSGAERTGDGQRQRESGSGDRRIELAAAAAPPLTPGLLSPRRSSGRAEEEEERGGLTPRPLKVRDRGRGRNRMPVG